MSEDLLSQVLRDIAADDATFADQVSINFPTEDTAEDIAPNDTDLNVNERINTLTGIFLKSVYFLDSNLTKCAIVGFVKSRGDELGVLFSGRKGLAFFSYDMYKQLTARSNDVTLALEQKKKKMEVKLNQGGSVKVRTVYGQQHVFLHDGQHKMSLSPFEWAQFSNNIPLMNSSLRDLALNEVNIKDFIRRLYAEGQNIENVKCDELPYSVASRLLDEVQYFKRWPNGGTDQEF